MLFFGKLFSVCAVAFAQGTQACLKPRSLGPMPILGREPISVIRAIVYFALLEDELP